MTRHSAVTVFSAAWVAAWPFSALAIRRGSGNVSEPPPPAEYRAPGPKQCIRRLHVWVEHEASCSRSSFAEDFGCDLIDFGHKKPMRDIHWFTASAHWNGGDAGQDKIIHGGTSEEGTCSQTYHMPDYCSRAIVSELSTVYDGYHRKASILAALKNAFDTMEEDCPTALKRTTPDKLYANILTSTPTKKACWGFGQDWRGMFCAKYARCHCSHNSREGCGWDKVQCCRDMYQLFLDAHPWTQKFYQDGAVAPQAARTHFSIRVAPEGDAGGTYWMRLAYREAVSERSEETPSRVFAEFSESSTFVEVAAVGGSPLLDLCGAYRIGAALEGEEAHFAVFDTEGFVKRYRVLAGEGAAVAGSSGLLGAAAASPTSGPQVAEQAAYLVRSYC